MATVFVGGSALLIAGAVAALAFGFINNEEPLVWTALVASGAAAVFLVFAYLISRRDLKRVGTSAKTEPDPATTQQPKRDEPDTRPSEAVADQEQTEVKEAAAEPSDGGDGDDAGTSTASDDADAGVPTAAALAGGSPTATKPSTTKKPSAPGTAAAAKPSSPSDSVVGIATKKKFHRPDCRYAKSDSAEDMTRATARKRGYTPCGICKP